MLTPLGVYKLMVKAIYIIYKRPILVLKVPEFIYKFCV